jgi:hypothetical protein
MEKSWVWWHICPFSNGRKYKIGESQSKTARGKNQRPSFQDNQSKKGWRYAQAAEHRPYKCEALSSNPSTFKTKAKLKKQLYMMVSF